MSNYTGTGISGPYGITAGSDGALWFTNNGNDSIGRITADGLVTNYTGTGISQPEEITAAPDGALWFTNFGNDSIGRITTAGTVSTYHGTAGKPRAITPGPDRALWFTTGKFLWRQLDRPDHHRRGDGQLHRIRHPFPEGRLPQALTGPCGSPTATIRSGGSRRMAW